MHLTTNFVWGRAGLLPAQKTLEEAVVQLTCIMMMMMTYQVRVDS